MLSLRLARHKKIDINLENENQFTFLNSLDFNYTNVIELNFHDIFILVKVIPCLRLKIWQSFEGRQKSPLDLVEVVVDAHS